jgi:hypothetical protein
MRLDTAQVGTFAYAYDRENRLITRAMAFPPLVFGREQELGVIDQKNAR